MAVDVDTNAISNMHPAWVGGTAINLNTPSQLVILLIAGGYQNSQSILSAYKLAGVKMRMAQDGACLETPHPGTRHGHPTTTGEEHTPLSPDKSCAKDNDLAKP